MEYGDLLNFVIVIGIVAVVIGVVVYLLDKLAATSGMTANAVAAINGTSIAIGGIGTTWVPILIIVGVLVILIGLLIKLKGSNR